MQRPPFVKICCIASVEKAQLAIALGASALDLVSQMPSGPGVIDDDLIAEIAASVPPPIATFLLTAHLNSAAIIAPHQRCRTSTIQRVNHVELAESPALRLHSSGIKLVLVRHVRDADALAQAKRAAPFLDALLLESAHPRCMRFAAVFSGWPNCQRLTASNVAEAIATVAPFGLDLCSSVRENGKLCAVKLAAFMAPITGYRASATST